MESSHEHGCQAHLPDSLATAYPRGYTHWSIFPSSLAFQLPILLFSLYAALSAPTKSPSSPSPSPPTHCHSPSLCTRFSAAGLHSAAPSTDELADLKQDVADLGNALKQASETTPLRPSRTWPKIVKV